MDGGLQADIEAVGAIDAVPTILDVVCRTTGMGFAAVARVTEERWIACAVRDEIQFGLQPGGELKVETTICNEIREQRRSRSSSTMSPRTRSTAGIHTPAMYGFQSYISMPIFLPGRRFLRHAVRDRSAAGAAEHAGDHRHVQAVRRADRASISTRRSGWRRARRRCSSERQSAELREQFIAVLGHDLRNPLASIDAGAQAAARRRR